MDFFGGREKREDYVIEEITGNEQAKRKKEKDRRAHYDLGRSRKKLGRSHPPMRWEILSRVGVLMTVSL